MINIKIIDMKSNRYQEKEKGAKAVARKLAEGKHVQQVAYSVLETVLTTKKGGRVDVSLYNHFTNKNIDYWPIVSKLLADVEGLELEYIPRNVSNYVYNSKVQVKRNDFMKYA